MNTSISLLCIILIIILTGCKKNVDQSYSIYIEEDLKVYIDLPNHCRYFEIHHDRFDASGLKYACPFNGGEYEIIIGKEHPEIRKSEQVFLPRSEEWKSETKKHLLRRDTSVSDFEFGRDYDLYTYQNDAYRSIYYKKVILIPSSDRLLSLTIRKRTGKSSLEKDIEEIKTLGQSFKF